LTQDFLEYQQRNISQPIHFTSSTLKNGSLQLKELKEAEI